MMAALVIVASFAVFMLLALCLIVLVLFVAFGIFKLDMHSQQTSWDIECPHCKSHDAQIVWSMSQLSYVFMTCKCMQCKQSFDVVHDMSDSSTHCVNNTESSASTSTSINEPCQTQTSTQTKQSQQH